MKGKLSFMWRATLALVLVLSLGVVMAVPVSAVGALSSVGATTDNYMAGATTTYEIAFTTATSGDVASVDMAFAAGFDVSAAAYSDRSGIGAGTVSVSAQVVTYTVTTPAAITAVTIDLSGIVNPSVADDYEPAVTITTKNLVGGAIDIGSANVTITAAPVSFLVAVPAVTAGTAFSVTITAKDEAAGAGSTVGGYTGDHLIDFSSTASDPKIIPAFAVITFGSGIGTLTGVVLNVVETGKTITATDSAISVSGTSSEITVTAGDEHHLTITGAPASVTAGVAFSTDVIVTAYDAGGNVDITETELISWTANDGTATAGNGLPANQSLVLGTYTFLKAGFVLEKVRVVDSTVVDTTITATGASNLSVTATVTVNPAAASTLTVAAATSPIAADGVASSIITATAKDAFGNTDTNYTASVTFATSLGTLSEVDANFVAGVATATLTSTTTGTATILVSSGTLTDVTETVTLTAAGIEVWVDGVGGHDSNPGTEASPLKTIAAGITAAGAGGTVNVGPGTYTPSTLTIDAAGLTLQSTGTTALTIIDATGDNAIYVDAHDVTINGFTLLDVSACGIYLYDADDATIENNVITFASSMKTGIDISPLASGVEVSGNTLNAYAAMILHGSDAMISGNAFGHVFNFWALAEATPLSGVTITGNTFPANSSANFAILLRGDGSEAVTIDNTLIEDNTITGRANGGILIGADSTGLILTNLTVTGNSIANSATGINIYSTLSSWGAGNTINNNNITGNVTRGIDNNVATTVIDARNNWWGDASGPLHTDTNAAGRGDQVTDNVDYSPWLTAAYSAPATTVSLESGWNLISLMLLPTDPDVDTVLAGADVTVNKVTYFTGGPTGGWLSWFPSAPSNLTEMNDGKGYWIDVSAAGTLTVTGVELALPGYAPPDYDVVVGWNLIGFTSTTGKTVDVYLGSVLATVEAMYGYNAATDLYTAIVAGNNLVPGQGYWLAVNTAGTIYP